MAKIERALQGLVALAEGGRRDQALSGCRVLLGRAREHGGVWCLLGMLLTDAGDRAGAIHALRTANRLTPGVADWQVKLALQLADDRRYGEALTWLEAAWRLGARDIPLCLGLAFVLRHLGRPAEALDALVHARNDDPGNVVVRFRLGECLALTGDLGSAWPEFEYSQRTRPVTHPATYSKAPLWTGEALPRARLLVVTEQGIGDMIQFSRYLPMAASRVGRVIVGRDPTVACYLGGFPGVDATVDTGSDFPEHDVVVGICMLPRLFRTGSDSIPAPIRPDVARSRRDTWKERLHALRPGRHGRQRVGLVWAGNPTHSNDAYRSARLADLVPLLDAEADFYSLQLKVPERDREDFDAERRLIDLSTSIRDLADTAAVIEHLDLVIAVDTAVAHLAATLGCATWLLNALPGDWRWPDRDARSAWYPSMEVFQQAVAGDWTGPVGAMRRRLGRGEPRTAASADGLKLSA